MMKLIVAIIYVIFVSKITFINCKNPEPTENFQHSAVLDQNNKVWLYWKFNETYITFEFHGNTKGWVGIGISPNGGMAGADMYVGWVNDGFAYISDHHGLYNGFPPKDPEQNVELLEGRESDGWTIIKFRRQLVGCEDSYDITIGTSTIKMIWALGYSDPTDEELSSSDYHGYGSERRGVKTLLLLESNAFCAVPTNESTTSFDLLNNNVSVPAKDTYYSCRLLQLPTLTSKHHITKVEPVIRSKNDASVHHILVYLCKYGEPKDAGNVGVNTECYADNMPPDFRQCQLVVLAWAIGGGTMCFPQHVGFPIGPGEPQYVVMETHYDNPALRSDIVDNSGLRIHYTSQLRQYDGGVLEVGLGVSPYSLLIPPEVESFNTYAECKNECLEKGLSSANISQINVIGTLLHSHLLGRKLTLHHIKNDTKTELPPIAVDASYDFNYQELKIHPEEIVIKSGETLQVQCDYNSKNRKKFTLGGLGTQQEMCLAFLVYYPRIPLYKCVSLPSPYYINRYFGVHYFQSRSSPWDTLKDMKIGYLNSTLYDVVAKKNWTAEYSSEFSKHVQHVPRYASCRGNSAYNRTRTRGFFNPPRITHPYIPTERKCIQPASGKTTRKLED